MQLLSTCKCGWLQKMKIIIKKNLHWRGRIVKKQQIKLRKDLGQKKKKKDWKDMKLKLKKWKKILNE